MTEAEDILVSNTLEEFWTDWVRIVNDTSQKVPEHLLDNLLTRMQEKATVYGALRP